MSFIIAGTSHNPSYHQAFMQMEKTILELSKTLNDLKRNFQENESEEIDKLCRK